ncbi:MAG: PTS sugar transporter subunit IIA [Planctomycetes bacterium]|nr:PTS sugar transporter subunit IIA [Planctomycetota bacterium]
MTPDPNANADSEFHEVDVPRSAASSKESVVRFLVGELAESCRISAEQVERITGQVMQRERIGTTGIGGGVAVPHVNTDGVSELAALVGRLAMPMDWQAIDGEPVRFVCLLLAPRFSSNAATRLRQQERVMRMIRTRLNRA